MYLGKRKSGIYFIEFFDDSISKMRRISTGSRTKADALKFVSSLKGKREMQERERIKKKTKTISEFHIEYKEFMKATHSTKYLNSIELAFNKFIGFLGAEVQIGQIKQKSSQLFLSDVFKRAKYSAYLYSRTLKAAFTRAVEWEYIDENPFKKVRLPKIPQNHPIFITHEELELIIKHCSDKTIRDIIITAFYTGMRLGELTNLKWDSIDLKSKVIRLRNDESFNTKSRKERIIPINDKLISIFCSENKKMSNALSNYVFKNSKGFKFNESFVSKNFKRVVRQAEIDERIHFHSLRHSFASNLVQKGVSLYVVKELLGHENITTTQIYSHLRSEDLYNAVQKI